MPEKWTKRSRPPSSGVMKPKPFSSENHLTVPVLTDEPHLLLARRAPILSTGPVPSGPNEADAIWSAPTGARAALPQLSVAGAHFYFIDPRPPRGRPPPGPPPPP